KHWGSVRGRPDGPLPDPARSGDRWRRGWRGALVRHRYRDVRLVRPADDRDRRAPWEPHVQAHPAERRLQRLVSSRVAAGHRRARRQIGGGSRQVRDAPDQAARGTGGRGRLARGGRQHGGAVVRRSRIPVTPAQVAVAKIADGAVVSGGPPAETPLHLGGYRARPEIRSVAHFHPLAATAFATVGKPLITAFNAGAPFGKVVPVY